MNKESFLYCLIIILVVVVATMLLTKKSANVESVVVTNTDTIIEYRYDTIEVEKPRYVYKSIIDTLYVTTNVGDSIPLVKEQKYYKEKEKYDIWVSGYNANLDSVKIYPQIITKNVILETEKTINKTNIYATLGFNAFNGGFIPNVGIYVSTKKKLLIGAEIGYYDKNLVYGLTAGIKLNK